MFLPPYDHPVDSGKEFLREGVRIRNVRMGKVPGLRYAAASYRLCREVVRYAPDVVHVFKPKGYAGAVLTYLLARGWKRVVLDCDDWEGWGGWNEAKTYSWAIKQFIDWQERFLIRHAPFVTVASRVLQARAVAIRGSTEGVQYLPNSGASREGREIRSRVLAADRGEIRRSFQLPLGPLILYSGHFEAGDDGMFFSKAAAEAARRTGAMILFVGEGPELGRVKQFFSLQPDIRVRFFNPLPYERFLSLLAVADVASYPYADDAVHRAKCSARIIDYMAMGCAVVTTRVGENNEHIQQGHSGILVPPGQEREFANALVTVLHDSRLRAFIGRNARRYVEESLWSDAAFLDICLAAYEAVTAPGDTRSITALQDNL